MGTGGCLVRSPRIGADPTNVEAVRRHYGSPYSDHTSDLQEREVTISDPSIALDSRNVNPFVTRHLIVPWTDWLCSRTSQTSKVEISAVYCCFRMC